MYIFPKAADVAQICESHFFGNAACAYTLSCLSVYSAITAGLGGLV
jgi:hypothetical protein